MASLKLFRSILTIKITTKANLSFMSLGLDILLILFLSNISSYLISSIEEVLVSIFSSLGCSSLVGLIVVSINCPSKIVTSLY